MEFTIDIYLDSIILCVLGKIKKPLKYKGSLIFVSAYIYDYAELGTLLDWLRLSERNYWLHASNAVKYTHNDGHKKSK